MFSNNSRIVALQNWQVRYSQPGTVLKSIPRGDVATDPDPVCPLGRPRAARLGDDRWILERSGLAPPLLAGPGSCYHGDSKSPR